MEEHNLVLARRIGESIIIDEHTTIIIKSINGHSVKFAIDSSQDIRRGEIEPSEANED